METTKNSLNARVAYFDIAKAFLIFLVVVGHIFIVLNPNYDRIYLTIPQAVIYSFHMPAFFIIHGILFNNEKWKAIPTKKFILKRLYTLIVPYVFFEIIGMIWKVAVSNQSLITGIYNMLTIRCNIGADWFLPALFMGSLLFLIYVKHPNRIYGIISVIVSFLLPMIMSGSQLTIVLGRGLLAYGFIMIGNLGKSFFQSEKAKKLLHMIGALLITGFVAQIGLKWYGNDFYSCTIENPLTFVIGGISGTYLILGISRYFNSNLISGLGKHTLIIMGTHQLVIYAMTSFVPNISGGSLLWGVGLLLITLIFEIPVVFIINKYLPFLIGKGLKKS